MRNSQARELAFGISSMDESILINRMTHLESERM
jgi:hypothetical protein